MFSAPKLRLPQGSAARRWVGGALALLLLAGCQADEVGLGAKPKHMREISAQTRQQMTELKMSKTSPVLMRIFKEENAFEVWKVDHTGRYALLKSYEICKWSGGLGPKIREGDRQAPEGYYKITPGLMNPNSSYFLAFNTGYPNSYDRALGRTGSNLMVHGACSSRGCYAMSDAQIQEIYAIARDAFKGGQKGFQLAAYPFRMTPENMARHIDDPNMPFWRMLKEGYDHFELTRMEPKVDVCGRKYVFNVTADAPMSPAEACPALSQPEPLRIAAAKKAAEDDAKTLVIAARLADEKKAAENAIMLAAREERERQVALADRPQTVASLFGFAAGSAPAAIPAAPVEPAAVAAAPAVTADGVPLPKPAPREIRMLAMAPQQPAADAPGSVVARMFSFGDDALPLPVPPASAVAPVAVADPAASATATASHGPTAGPLPAAACDTTSGAPATGAGCTEMVSAAPSPMSEENQSIVDRIGNWF